MNSAPIDKNGYFYDRGNRPSGPFSSLTVIELDSFVAGPYAGMTLAQLGADVIRIDPIGGGPDVGRWPISKTGRSLYWAGLNKGKRSICIDLLSDEGRKLLRKLVGAANERYGAFLTNITPGGWLSYEWLAEVVPDLVMCHILGNPDGSAAVDYTINSAMGYPLATGPGSSSEPVNSVLPAWDLITGMHAALAIVSAFGEKNRGRGGQKIEISLADVALSVVGALGNIAEVSNSGTCRQKDGNYIYGSFGMDFSTSDCRKVMVVALTPKQWKALCAVTQTLDLFQVIEKSMQIDLMKEGVRYENRELISSILKPWFRKRSFEEVCAELSSAEVLWGPYQDFKQLVESDPRCSIDNPLFEMLFEPSIGTFLVPKSPIKYSRTPTSKALNAPLLGTHSREIVEELLDLDRMESNRLLSSGVIWEPA